MCNVVLMILSFAIIFLVASVGISFLQFTNMNSMRNLMITGLSLFLGISIPQYFSDTFSTSGHGPVNTRAGWVSHLHHFFYKHSHTAWIFLFANLFIAKEGWSFSKTNYLNWLGRTSSKLKFCCPSKLILQ